MFIVISTLLWPNRFWTVLTRTPSCSASVAAVCRSPWNLIRRTPAFSINGSNSRSAMLLACSGSPRQSCREPRSSFANTNPCVRAPIGHFDLCLVLPMSGKERNEFRGDVEDRDQSQTNDVPMVSPFPGRPSCRPPAKNLRCLTTCRRVPCGIRRAPFARNA